MLFLVLGLAVCLTKASPAQVEVPRVPATVVAGSDFSIFTPGSGKAAFYLVGPGHSSKQEIALGRDIHIKGDEATSAGRYLAVVCTQTCQSASFYVTPTDPAALTFLVHPSRVPVQEENAISGAVFPFDRFHNLVLSPVTVNFTLTADGRASSPCNLRIKAQRTKSNIVVETDPVRDCSGNMVPDGTIVTFTRTAVDGKSTVDVPIKQGVARAQMTPSAGAVISVASGVVMGNPISIGERP